MIRASLIKQSLTKNARFSNRLWDRWSCHPIRNADINRRADRSATRTTAPRHAEAGNNQINKPSRRQFARSRTHRVNRPSRFHAQFSEVNCRLAQLKLLSRPSWSRPRDSGLQRQGGVGTARPWSRSSAALRSPFPPPSHNSPSIARRSSISEIPRPSKPPRYETITPCDQSSSMRTQSRKAPRALAHKVSRLPKAIRAYEQHYYLKGERGER
jgi:hypothetical protein